MTRKATWPRPNYRFARLLSAATRLVAEIRQFALKDAFLQFSCGFHTNQAPVFPLSNLPYSVFSNSSPYFSFKKRERKKVRETKMNTNLDCCSVPNKTTNAILTHFLPFQSQSPAVRPQTHRKTTCHHLNHYVMVFFLSTTYVYEYFN